MEFAGAVYHVMARGDRREAIVEDDDDRKAFELLWEQVVEQTGWEVLAWVLMNNHYHAVLRTPEPNLVEGMKWIQNTWTRRFNVRHARWGHVYGDRYKSILCEDGAYLSRLIDYVHLNPVRAGLVREDTELKKYRWSSLWDYVLPVRQRRKWLAVGAGLGESGHRDDAKGRRHYLTQLNESVDWQDIRHAGLSYVEGQSLQSTLRRGWYFGGEEFREGLLEKVEGLLKKGKRSKASGYSGAEVSDHRERMAERIVAAGMEELGLEETDLGVVRKGDKRKVIIASLVRQKTTMPLGWIAEHLKMGVPSRVSKECAKAAGLLKNDRKLKKAARAILKKSKIH